MQAVSSPVRFMREAPVGCFARGRRFVVGFPTRKLFILIGWGGIGHREASELAAALRAQHVKIAPHAAYVDLRRVVSVDPEALRVLSEAQTAMVDVNTIITTRTAIVHSTEPSGMAVAGFFQVVDAGHPVRMFTDPAAALRWLGHPRSRIAADLAAWDRLLDANQGRNLTVRLRELLERSPSSSVSSAARALGVSSRTLQRELQRDRTSYRRESEAARIRSAQEQLLDQELSIKQVAAAVGFASPTAFATCFRRLTGRSPTVWRRAALARSRT